MRYGHHANESTFLVIGKRKRAVVANISWVSRMLRRFKKRKKKKKKVKPESLAVQPSLIWTAEEARETEEEKLIKVRDQWKTANNRENPLIRHWELIEEIRVAFCSKPTKDFKKDSGTLWHFGKHRHNVASCGMPVKTKERKKERKSCPHSLSHTFFCFSFFTHLLNFVLQRKEGKTHNIHNSHAHDPMLY